MFKSFLKYLSKARDGNDPLILHQNIIRKWSEEEVYTLKQLGVLRQASPANSIICPGCEEYCHETVETRLGQDGKSVERFVRCGVWSTNHEIPIKPADLEQRQLDVKRFVSLLASALDIDEPPTKIIPHQAFSLGIIPINRKKRTAIFVDNNKTLNASVKTGRFKEDPHPFFLVAGGPAQPETTLQKFAFSLSRLLMFSDGSLSFDKETLEYLISASDVRQVENPPRNEKAAEKNIFRKEGTIWTLRYDGRTKRLNNLKGLTYISYLLGSPRQEFHVSEIIKAAENPTKKTLSFSSGEISTRKTTDNYRKRLAGIQIEMEEAKKSEELVLFQELLREKEALEKEIMQAFGMGGKLKKNPDETRRDAKAVSGAIYRSLGAINKTHLDLWRHLNNTISLGEFLSYTPETDISWITIQ
jgi:hypothetical protein